MTYVKHVLIKKHVFNFPGMNITCYIFQLFGYIQTSAEEAEEIMVGEEVSIFTVSKRRRVGEAAGTLLHCKFHVNPYPARTESNQSLQSDQTLYCYLTNFKFSS